jgi:YegS/Rv2252/BmrU family lipid kinase
MKRVFMFNPKAGGGISARRLREIERYFLDRTGSFDAIRCESRGDLTRRTRDALLEGAEQIVAIGGDGTMNAAANGFFEQGRSVAPAACLAVSRLGTGSDYLKTLAPDRTTDWRDVALNPVLRAVDVGAIRMLDGSRPPIHFLNIASFGMSGEIVRRKQLMPSWLPRSLCYLLPTLTSLFGARPRSIELELDGQSLRRDALCLFASKGIFAGGGMRFGGGVTLDDGLFDVMLFTSMTALQMLLKTPKLYSGDYADETSIEKHTARSLRFRSPTPLTGECDGELIGAGDFEITLAPRALQVCCPAATT